jgi:hypothetical protein
MTLREALEAKVKEWRGCLERPPAYRCRKCPDGDYVWHFPGTTHKEQQTVGYWHKRTGKTILKDEEVEVADPMVMKCLKCGHVLPPEERPVSIGPLYDMGSYGELDSICEELEKLLKESE